MNRQRVYPDRPVGPFPTPPRTVTDGVGREVRLRAVGREADAVDPDVAADALVEMYVDYDPADRAQGLPPIRRDRIREWIEGLSTGGTLNVVACHGETVVGHALLVPDELDAYELAIFVQHGYQEAGIGTALIRTLLGLAASAGVERVWLAVERWNAPAIGLYEKVGFETADVESFELEMSIRLAQTDSTG